MNARAGEGAPLIVTLRSESGEELPFEIDTGAFSTVIDSSLTNQLGRLRGKAVGGGFIGRPVEDMDIYNAPKLYLGDTLLRTSKLIVTKDLRGMSRRRPLKGILGMDCLKHYCLQLDFDRREIRFLDPAHLNVAELGKAFPLGMKEAPLNGAQVFVDSTLSEQRDVRFWVDTGFSGGRRFNAET
jgi:hypothetical protein